LFWIPTHILTFSMRYFDDYQAARIPTFPAAYGFAFTRAIIALSSVLAALTIGWASILIGVSAGVLRLMAVLSAGLLWLALATFRLQSERINFGLFKYASLYMLATMLLLAI
jgi:protoheme IX farnesyltransferase